MHMDHPFCVNPSTDGHFDCVYIWVAGVWEGISSTYSNLISFEMVPGGVTAGSRESSLFSTSHFHFKYFS